MAHEQTLTVKDTGKIKNLLPGTLNLLTVKTQFAGHKLEMEDVNFHFDSTVLMPDFGPFAPKTGTPEQNRITGLAVLYACYKHAQEDREKKKGQPDETRQRLLIAGHTDRKGGPSYNEELSNLRAENIRCALVGDKDGWVKICNGKSPTRKKNHQVEDYQQILKWIAWNWDWDCDPGDVNNEDNSETREATRKFQVRYNVEFTTAIDEDGKVGRETWGAFFDLYTRELKAIMGVDDVGLADARSAVLFLDKKPPAVGCGENFPKSEAPHDCKNLKKSSASDQENAIDRRVELLFFDPDEVPKLECHAKKDCVPSKCDLYCGGVYKFEPIPLNPVPLPSGLVARVFLTIAYNDPEGTTRPFPENFPVKVVFPDATTQDEVVGKEGKLTFQVERSKQSFTLRFESDLIRYFASPTSETTGEQAERFLFEPEVPAAIADHCRVFKLPLSFSLSDSDFDVVGASTYTRPDFAQLEDKSLNIGSEASRVQVTLNPHWQYVKFLYFDRWVKQQLSLPPIIIESFAGTAPAPVARSNWLSSTGCQCLPWIIQRTSAGAAAPMPDATAKLQFRAVPSTFVQTSGTAANNSRRLVTISTGSPSPPPSDIGLNAGQHLNFDVSVPRASRLAFYDLPIVWKSRTYFAQLSGGTGNPPASQGQFETLVAQATTDAAPLLISLDDMVLTDETLAPIAWVPDTQVKNRVAIFANTFSNTGPSSADLSTVGLYKADTANKQPWFTQRPAVENTRNYIADYPQWTRAIITQGNLFSAFDRRTPDGPSGVVGARAAVRHIDVFASSQTFVPPGTQRPSAPASTVRSFATINPLYQQLHDKFWTNSDTDDRGIGRFDLMLLRCCDVATDGVTEVAQVLNYFRFFFSFNPSFTPEGNPNAVPRGLTGTAAANWVSTGIQNLLIRWNGPDGTHNPGRAQLRTPSSSASKIHAGSLWFAQDLPRTMAHYEMGIFKHFTLPADRPKNVRAYMSADRGEGVLDEQQNGPQTTTGSSGVTLSGTFTFAHETGHGGSLGDEYVEQTSPTSLPTPWLPGFDSFSPGSPFVFDITAMMEANQQVRARYFWQVAEWLRSLIGAGLEFEVVHGTHTYKLPHHAQSPRKTFVNFPAAFVRGKEMGPHGKFDVFLYPLGDEEFSATLLPNRATPPVAAYDGMIVIVVKMQIDFDIDNKTTIHNWLSAVHTQVNRRFNNKFCARGNVGGRAYQRALLQFAPRYRVDDYSATDPFDTREHIKIDIPDTGVPEWDSGIIFVSRTKLFFPRNQPPNVFARFFGHMVGLADGTFDTPASYEPIARLVMPDASVQNV